MGSISELRQELAILLGNEDYRKYMAVIRDWFANKHNRQDWEFDMPFLKGRAKEVHNNIMTSILRLCMSPDFDKRTRNVVENCSYVNDTEQVALSNVITLHSAPMQEAGTPGSTHTIDIDPPSSVDPSRVTWSEDEGDPEEPVMEDDGSQDMQLQPMFTMHLRKAKEEGAEETRLFQPQRKVERRFPVSFVKEFKVNQEEIPSGIPNVTHSFNIGKYIALDPEQGKYFQTRKPGEPYLTCNATIPGRILLKVWSMGIQSIDPKVLEIASRAAHERVQMIIRELIKQRKSFRMTGKRNVKFGEPHENPYLLSKHHCPPSRGSEKMPYSTILVDPITLPPDADIIQKSEQMDAMRAATSIDTQSRFNTKIGMTELLQLAKAKPSLFPDFEERMRLTENCLLSSKGFFESMAEDNSCEMEEEGELLPLVSY